MRISRRNWMQAAGGAVLTRGSLAAEKRIQVVGREVEIQLIPVSAFTFRLSLRPIKDGKPAEIPPDGSLVARSWAAPTTTLGAVRVENHRGPVDVFDRNCFGRVGAATHG